jgi:hypothetical protein
MKINTIVLLFILIINKGNAQEIKTTINGVEYSFCTSLASASYIVPDSVKGLLLQSKGYQKFPIEILKYQNIEALDFSSVRMDEMVEYLNKKEKKEYNKRKKNGGEQFGYPLFKPNFIRTVPDSIFVLKKLRIINFMDMYVTIDAIKKIEKLLPQCIVIPSSRELEMEKELHSK